MRGTALWVVIHSTLMYAKRYNAISMQTLALFSFCNHVDSTAAVASGVLYRGGGR